MISFRDEEGTMLRKFLMVTCAALLAAGAAQAQRTLKINESLGPGSPEEAALKAFQKSVEEGARPACDDALTHVAGQVESGDVETGGLAAIDGVLERNRVDRLAGGRVYRGA